MYYRTLYFKALVWKGPEVKVTKSLCGSSINLCHHDMHHKKLDRVARSIQSVWASMTTTISSDKKICKYYHAPTDTPT